MTNLPVEILQLFVRILRLCELEYIALDITETFLYFSKDLFAFFVKKYFAKFALHNSE